MAGDEALVRMRRSMEWAGLISRSVSVVWIIASFLFLPPAPGLPYPGPSWLLGVLMALPEALINILGVYALRSVSHRRYPRLSATIVVVDTATIIAMVYAGSSSPELVLWPLFIIPVIVAAYRHQLAGALLAALATSTAGVVLFWQAERIAGHPLSPDLVTFAPCLLLVVALTTGLLSRAHRNHLRQLAVARATLREQALHDPLTGLGNRNLLHEHSRTALRPGEQVSVLVLDLDGFKAVNDSLGHAAGDELLRVVAGRLRSQARERDLVARLGGDEFVLMLHDTGATAAREIAERLRAALVAPIALAGEPDGPGRTVRIDASIGVATARDEGLDNLLRAADADMYRVKSAHRILRTAAPFSPPTQPAAAAAT